MSAVTAPPVIFNLAVPARDDSAGSHYFGPFPVGANLYAVLISEAVSPPPFHRWLNVYKSTDKGATWTTMDSANRPDTSATCDPLTANGQLVLSAGVMTIVYASAAVGNPLKIVTFDTGSDTFGVPSADGPLTNGTARIAQFSSGDLCVWYGGFTLGLQAAVIFSGGAWGSPVTVPNSKNSVCTIVMGANNVAQLFYNDQNAPGINVFFRTFTNPGVLGAEQNVFSGSVLINTPGSSIPIGRTLIWNGNFVVPYYGGPNGNQAGVWIGTPYTAPVWAFTIVDPISQGPQITGVQSGDVAAFALVDASNNLALFWITENAAFPAPPAPGSVNRIYYAVNSGAGFGLPVLFYNETTNPQLVDPSHPNDFLHTLSVHPTAGAITAIDITNPSGVPGPTFCAGFFLLLTGGILKRCLQ